MRNRVSGWRYGEESGRASEIGHDTCALGDALLSLYSIKPAIFPIFPAARLFESLSRTSTAASPTTPRTPPPPPPAPAPDADGSGADDMMAVAPDVSMGMGDSARARKPTMTMAERLRRGMRGEMAADLLALLGRARPVVAKSAGVLGTGDVDVTQVLAHFVQERIAGPA